MQDIQQSYLTPEERDVIEHREEAINGQILRLEMQKLLLQEGLRRERENAQAETDWVFDLSYMMHHHDPNSPHRLLYPSVLTAIQNSDVVGQALDEADKAQVSVDVNQLRKDRLQEACIAKSEQDRMFYLYHKYKQEQHTQEKEEEVTAQWDENWEHRRCELERDRRRREREARWRKDLAHLRNVFSTDDGDGTHFGSTNQARYEDIKRIYCDLEKTKLLTDRYNKKLAEKVHNLVISTDQLLVEHNSGLGIRPTDDDDEPDYGHHQLRSPSPLTSQSSPINSSWASTDDNSFQSNHFEGDFVDKTRRGYIEPHRPVRVAAASNHHGRQHQNSDVINWSTPWEIELVEEMKKQQTNHKLDWERERNRELWLREQRARQSKPKPIYASLSEEEPTNDSDAQYLPKPRPSTATTQPPSKPSSIHNPPPKETTENNHAMQARLQDIHKRLRNHLDNT